MKKHITFILILSGSLFGCYTTESPQVNDTNTIVTSGPAEAIVFSDYEDHTLVWTTEKSKILDPLGFIWLREDGSQVPIIRDQNMGSVKFVHIHVVIHDDWVEVELANSTDGPRRTSFIKKDKVIQVLMK